MTTIKSERSLDNHLAALARIVGRQRGDWELRVLASPIMRLATRPFAEFKAEQFGSTGEFGGHPVTVHYVGKGIASE